MINAVINHQIICVDDLPVSNYSYMGHSLDRRNYYYRIENSSLPLIERIKKFFTMFFKTILERTLFFSAEVKSQWREVLWRKREVVLVGDPSLMNRLPPYCDLQQIKNLRDNFQGLEAPLTNRFDSGVQAHTNDRFEDVNEEGMQAPKQAVNEEEDIEFNQELTQVQALNPHLDSVEAIEERELPPELLEFIRSSSRLSLPIADLAKFERLDLAGIDIRFLPESICDLPELKTLLIMRIPLESIPERIGNLSKLEELSLCGSRVRILPESICDLSELRTLGIGPREIVRGPLEAIPERIGNLSKLQYLMLVANSLQSLPDSIGNLSSLYSLNLGSNSLQSLPDSIGNLSNLRELDLYDNCLESIPDSIGNLSNLRELDLENNFLESIPESLFRLDSNCVIHLEGNRLLPLEVIEQLLLRVEDPNYRGPRFYVDIPDRPQVNEPVDLSIILDNWIEADSAQRLMTRLNQEQKNNLRDWLLRLRETSDYLVREEFVKEKTALFLKWLADEQNEANLQVAYQVLAEATSTCGDRVALSFNTLLTHVKLCQSNSLSLTDLKDLIIGVKRLDLLHQIAEHKCSQLRLVDPVEVHLYYESQLKDELGLPGEVEGMLYPRLAGVTNEDLTIAREQILEETTLNKQPHLLLEHAQWKSALERSPDFAKIAGECSQLKQVFLDQMDVLNGEMMELHYSTFQENDQTIWNPFYILTRDLLFSGEEQAR